MTITDAHNHKIAKHTFASVYPAYLKKVETKGRTKEELHQVIEWLTGFNETELQEFIREKATLLKISIIRSLKKSVFLTSLLMNYQKEKQ